MWGWLLRSICWWAFLKKKFQNLWIHKEWVSPCATFSFVFVWQDMNLAGSSQNHAVQHRKRIMSQFEWRTGNGRKKRTTYFLNHLSQKDGHMYFTGLKIQDQQMAVFCYYRHIKAHLTHTSEVWHFTKEASVSIHFLRDLVFFASPKTFH